MGREKPSTVTIYAVRCKVNGKVYIGRTSDLESRIKAHLSELRGKRKFRGRKFTDWQLDFNEYGEDAFVVYTLEGNVDKSEAVARERYWINEYRSTDRRYGYNIRDEKYTGRIVQYEEGLPPKPPAETEVGDA